MFLKHLSVVILKLRNQQLRDYLVTQPLVTRSRKGKGEEEWQGRDPRLSEKKKPNTAQGCPQTYKLTMKTNFTVSVVAYVKEM